MELLEALRGMDPADETQWRKCGRPRMDYLTAATGAQVTRQAVETLAPDFRRPAHGWQKPIPGPVTTATLDLARAELATARATLKQAQAVFEASQARLDALIEAEARENPDDFTRRNKAFLRKQNELRAQRQVEQAGALEALGLRPLAPIDQALARRRETDRPTMKVLYGTG